MRLLETCAYGIKACFCLSRSAIAAFTAAAARWAGARAEGCGTTCCGTRPEEVAQVGGSAPGVRMERVKYRERTAGPRGRTAPLSQRRPKSAVRPALPAVPLRAMPVAPRFRHGAVAAPACLPIRASLFSLVFYCPKRKSRSPTRCCFPSTRAGTGLQQEAAGSGLSDPGRHRPTRHGTAPLGRSAPHRTAPRRSPAGCADPAALPHGRPRSPGPSPAGPQYGSCPRPRHVPQGQRHEPPAHPPHPATQRNATPPARLTAGTEEEQQQRETGGAARRCHTAGRGALPRGRRARQQRRHRSCEGRGGAADRRGGGRSHGSRIGRPSRCRGRADFLRRAGLAAGPPGFHRALRGVCRLSHPGRRGFLI